MTTVLYISFSKSAKQRIIFSLGFFSRRISLTDLNPVNGLKMWATSRSVASAGIPSTYMVLEALAGT